MSTKEWRRPPGVTGPLRELNDALHQLRVDADHISTRDLHSAVEATGIVASSSSVYRAFTASPLPKRTLVLAIARVLAPLAVPERDPDEEAARFEALWSAASRSARPPAPTPVPAGDRIARLASTLAHINSQMPMWEREVEDLSYQAEAERLRTLLSSTEISVQLLTQAKRELGSIRKEHQNRASKRRKDRNRIKEEHKALHTQYEQSQKALDLLKGRWEDTARWLGRKNKIAGFDLTPFSVPAPRESSGSDVPEAAPLPPLVLEEITTNEP